MHGIIGGPARGSLPVRVDHEIDRVELIGGEVVAIQEAGKDPSVLFQDIDVVLGAQRPNSRVVVIAIHLDEVVGKASGNDSQQQAPVL